MEMALVIIEKSILLIGIACVLFSLFEYGKRSQDWKGVVTVFYKRVDMTVNEFKFYKFGVSLLVFAVIFRIAILTFFP
ncbi:hypothetical protein [Vibrio algivorus]|uniref:Uncharacterized protein n=1 Tax=Vibrio algivorus TaxID=1667024 RepID=A0A557NTE8_9VIBR|nr:hypothetical protein [Vibrio algivorus]TVO31708.1 hypothetical protein FOF44_17810 [Vibrio algivorus]GLT13742.1 hypothetical protein GCM10007931_07160 [Vibrio algivorus]